MPGKVIFRSVLSVVILLSFMTATAALAAQETAAQKADNGRAEFQRKARAKFDQFDKKFRQWSEEAKAQGEKVYHEQKKEIEKSRVKAANNIHKLNAEGKRYSEKSWRKLKEETDKSLDEFGKTLERAGEKLRK